MVQYYPCCNLLFSCSVLILLFQTWSLPLYAQPSAGNTTSLYNKSNAITDSANLLRDTSVVPVRLLKDTLRSTIDTTLKGVRTFAQLKKQQSVAKIKTGPGSKWPSTDSVKIDMSNPFRNMLISKPVLRLNGGYVSYQFNYRSVIDTPYAEKDIVQHNVMGRLDMTVAGFVPLQVNYWLRQSNSNFFRNIADVQVSFSGAALRNKLQTGMRNRLLALAPSLQDSLLEKLYALKQLEQMKLGSAFKNIFHPQKLIEANEILRLPGITWQSGLPDSVNIVREDSMKKAAAFLLDEYAKTKQQYEQLNGQVDSLKQLYEKNLQKIAKYRQLINGQWNELQTGRQIKNKLDEFGLGNVNIPPGYRWLLGVRNFSVGRSPVSYSELTAKNISVNGVNFEYNSWYYLAVTAGTVNYRFRDFVINGFNKQPQYLYMVRAGIGRLEHNYFIVSAFRGQKQLFRTGSAGNTTAGISGVSAETRLEVNRNTYVTAEVAKSIAPDYRNNPAEYKTRFTLSDKTNQAIAVKIYSWWPSLGSRIEGFYKKTGANFQSFSSFQTSSALESWYVKAEQSFFDRKLRLTGSVRKNEFSNPFIVQQYTSNTVFKSLTASLRIRKWPVITAGYQPLSQLTKVDNQIIENRFQTFNTTLYHQYAVKQLRMATTVMWNRFYNDNTDTGFVYYNAVNSYLMQSFFFKAFTANIGASHTKNGSYTLQVLDGYIQPGLGRLGEVGVGIKINNMNQSEIKAGAYVNASIHIHKQDVLMLSYEHGYLPGISGTLVRNVIGSVQFIKTFNFR
jgi:hypothetical protein